MPNFALHFGYVYRRIDNLNVLVNTNRPMSAYNVPTTIRDPGVDGVLGNADDGPEHSGLQSERGGDLALPVVNTRTNLPGLSEFHTIEYSATKRSYRIAGRCRSSGSIRMNRDNDTRLLRQQPASRPGRRARRTTLINTDDGRYNFSTWTFKVNGIVSSAVGHHPHAGTSRAVGSAVRPHLPRGRGQRDQLRQPAHPGRAHRHAQAGQHRHPRLADREALQGGQGHDLVGVRSTSTTSATPTRPRTSRGVGGSSFLLPSTIIGPRIARFGLKYDW